MTLAKNGKKGAFQEAAVTRAGPEACWAEGLGSIQTQGKWGLEPRVRVGSAEGQSARGRSGGGGCSSHPANRGLEGRPGDGTLRGGR